MTNFALTILGLVLLLLIALSSFFSSAETGMMAINRYRLKNLARKKNLFAIATSRLLERTDKLLGIILLGNTLANIAASAITTIIAGKLFGEVGIAIATLLLTFVILMFGEVIPKTIAAVYPQKFAFIAVFPLVILLKIFYPIVFIVNSVAIGFLRVFNVHLKRGTLEKLTSEELTTVVSESTGGIPKSHQEMLLAVLRLEKLTVEDVMVPKHKIVGIDLTEPWEEILISLSKAKFTRVPLYEEDINQIKGVVNLPNIIEFVIHKKELTREKLLQIAEEPYFIPENTYLPQQLLHFRSQIKHLAFVVDEYGDIQGLITVEDILEEIVGEFSTNIPALVSTIEKISEHSYLVDADINLRDLNRRLHTNFSTQGPKTLNGTITEYLEVIPSHNLCLKLSGYKIEVVEILNHQIKRVIVYTK